MHTPGTEPQFSTTGREATDAPLSADETARIVALRALHILDTATEERFDRITRLATRLFDVPIALISLVDVNRQWFKSCVGLPDSEMPRSISFCAHAILEDEPLVIRDARLDPRFADNPLVTEEPYIRFYAGQPLRGPGGHKIGTLCIIDRSPREMREADVQALRDLAVFAENELNTVELSQALLSRREAEAALQEAYQFNADVISNAQEGVVVYDRDLRYLLWNPFMEKLTGLRFEQVRGKSALEVFPHLRQEEIHDLLQRALRGETVRSQDVPYRVPLTDRTGWATGCYAPYRDASREIVGVIGIINDITERKRVEEALQESEGRYRSLVETSPDAIALIDLEGTLLMLNQQGAELFGCASPAELIGTSVFDLVTAEERLRVMEDMQRTLESGSVRNFQYTLLRRDGTAVPVEASGSVVLDSEGKPVAFTAVVRDVTERKRGEELRARLFAREQAARAEAEAAEAELAAVAEQMPSGLMAVDGEGRMTFINEAGWRILGMFPGTSLPIAEQAGSYMVREPFTGRPLSPEEMPIPRALAGEMVQGHEAIFRRPDEDQDVWIQVSAGPVRDANDLITGAVAVYSDVTQERKLLQDLKASEEALRQGETRFRMLWESSADAMALSNPEGIVLNANPAYYQLYGFTPEEVIGKSFAIIFPEEVRDWAKGEYIRTFNSEEIAPAFESLVRRADGTERIVESRYDFLVQDGERVAMLSTIRDITERKRVEEERTQLLAQEREIAERLRMMEQWRTAFLRIMSHELRTPLSQIIGFTDLINREADRLSERGRRYLSNIRVAAGSLESLGVQSFDLMRLYGDMVRLEQERIEVRHLAETALESYRARAGEKDIELSYTQPAEQIEVRGDRQRLDQALDILLDNAMKFTPAGGTIEVRAHPMGERVEIAVVDSGPGVPEEMREYIFSGQAEDVMTRRHGGTGLSLLMARRIAELHGGALRLEPTVQGACFILSLPVAR